MLGICNSWTCVLAVPEKQQQRARRSNQRSNKRMTWQVVDVRKSCSCDRTVWISTDVLQNFQVVLALDNTQRIAEQELNKKCWIEVMQLILRHVEIRMKL